MSLHAGRDVPQGAGDDKRDEEDAGAGEGGEAEGASPRDGELRGESRAEAIRAWLDRQGSSPNKSLFRLNASINMGAPLDDVGAEDQRSCGEELQIPRVPALTATSRVRFLLNLSVFSLFKGLCLFFSR